MASKAELMALSMPATLASKLGTDTLTSFTAAGTTQGTATSLTSNFSNVTTPSASANGVLLTEPFNEYFVYNSGPSTLQVYPPVGGTFVGLAINVAVTVASGSSLYIVGDGLNFISVIGGP